MICESLDPAERDGYPIGGKGVAGLVLVPVDEPGAPATWIVNEPLRYRRCAACPTRVVVTDETTMPEEWAPQRTTYLKGRGPSRPLRVDRPRPAPRRHRGLP